ncbi:MAG: twin-arginine translocation signal domain-containing protein [Planctomycetes bacterium]|nr:twin-arginine translocation signal domain-containing protein [Planctomycetota bacterium]
MSNLEPGNANRLPQGSKTTRRQFLGGLGVLPVAAATAQAAAPSSAPAGEAMLPVTPFGKYSLSRLICGANPFNAGSHLSGFVNRAMREHYTPEQILKTLRRCQEVGINGWQAAGRNLDLYRRLVAEGGRMHFLSLGSEPPEIEELAQAGTIGIAHHGEVTDRLFKAGQLDTIHDYLTRVRDAGLMVGVSTHMPAVIDAVESKGWDVDFYMACVYERHRSAQELEKLLGQVPLPVGEVYLSQDPPRMFRAMRQTRRLRLAFKILAAGRLSDRKPWVEQAFRQTFESIKPNDAVIIGIYDRYSDQPAENAEYVRRFSPLSRPA